MRKGRQETGNYKKYSEKTKETNGDTQCFWLTVFNMSECQFSPNVSVDSTQSQLESLRKLCKEKDKGIVKFICKPRN